MGTAEIIVVAGVLLLLFGGSKMKDLARGLGESSKELKKVKREIEDGAEEVKETVKF